MPNPVLNHVTVEVHPDRVEGCLRFYRDVLGFTQVESKVENSAWFKEGVHLFWGEGIETSPDHNYAPPPRHFALEVGVINYDRIVGACIRRALFIAEGTAYWGCRRCFVRDPSNNRIEIMEWGPF